MRRLDALEDESLPDLPELPTMSDNEYTLPESPQQQQRYQSGGMSRLLSPRVATDTPRANNNNNNNVPSAPDHSNRHADTPFTSTPASFGTLSDRTAMPMTAMTQRTTTSSEATVRVSQHARLQQRTDDRPFLDRDATSTQHSRMSLHLPSILDDEFSRDDSAPNATVTSDDEEDDEDMVVLSGGSGTESDQRRRTQSQHARQLDVPESARARRLSAASANISVRRKAGRISASAGTDAQRDPEPLKAHPAQTPLRQRDVNNQDLTLPTPEVGRHQSPAPSDSFPSLSTPHASHSDFESHTFATPAPQTAQVSLDLTPPATLKLASPEAQRRANHVLTTLRSTAKLRMVRGTPHPRRPLGPQLVDTPKPGQIAQTDESDAQEDVTATSNSSSDLTNLHARGVGSRRANTSLPTAVEGADPDTRPATGARFNGAKLNAYLHQLNTHLSDENKTLSKELDESRQEVGRLREESLASSRMEQSRDDPAALQQLRAELDHARSEADTAKRAMHEKVAQLTSRVDELLVDLEDKDRELENARKHVDEQEGEFADKMQRLEEELCRVMEEQEQGVEQARKEIEAKRQADEAYWQAESAKLEETRTMLTKLERELEAVTAERDQLKRTREDSNVDSDGDEQARISGRQVSELQALVSQLESRVQIAEQREEQARQFNVEHADNLKQTEEALDESARQLVQAEEELQSLRQQLAAEKHAVSSLKAQISQLSLTKAKSPLANEAFNADKDAIIQSLEDELDHAQKDVIRLKDELVRRDSATDLVKAQDLQIQALESHRTELESRVTQLKQQSMSQTSPLRTPEKSLLFRSILGLKTPKTPGQFLSNMTAWTPASGDTTIQPLLAQIEELELEKERLIEQLNSANNSVDDKLIKLEQAGSGTVSLVRQLSDAKAKIARLEAELDRLLGRSGVLQKAKTKLTNLSCPACAAIFDANKVVRLRVDDLTDGELSTASLAALKEALRTLSERIQSWPSERRVDLVSESIAAVEKVPSGDDQQFGLARGALVDLETDLRDKRCRLQTLADEKASAIQAEASVRSRLASAESDLRLVKVDLSKAASRDESIRLRAERDDLVSERAELLQNLASAETRVHTVMTGLGASGSVLDDIRLQLDDNLRLAARLRNDLATNTVIAKSHRDKISKSIAELQAHLQRVRHDSSGLSADFAAARQESNTETQKGEMSVEIGKLRDELRATKRKLNVYEDKVTKHTCSTDSTIMIDLKERHSAESKGLLSLVKYFKQRVEREASFRSDLSFQKGFLQATLQDKQSALDLVSKQLGLASFESDTKQTRTTKRGGRRRTFKAVALSIIALNRMRTLSEHWKSIETTKLSMRKESYPQVRGRSFPA
ncbi:hypothetical protein OIV83_006371 [Microbotryomycetes sp. JL201]|nr:hypothetical protein OIV83_006371 [Microbotryomycetes sp. JL201]